MLNLNPTMTTHLLPRGSIKTDLREFNINILLQRGEILC